MKKSLFTIALCFSGVFWVMNAAETAAAAAPAAEAVKPAGETVKPAEGENVPEAAKTEEAAKPAEAAVKTEAPAPKAEEKKTPVKPAVVTADRLNVRLGAGIKKPVAGVLVRGTKVEITGKKGAWLELNAPKELKVYVSEVYIVNGKVTSPLTMRPAMDSKSVSLGELAKDTEVEIVSREKYGWVRIVPPKTLKVYAFEDYIEEVTPEAVPVKTDSL